MPRAVRFDHYGGIDVLNVVEVPRPAPGDGELLVAVKAAAINPGEAKIRDGLLDDIFPATFPSGEGSDLAGVVEEVGPGVSEFVPGDEVIGFTDNRASHAELVLVEAANAVPRPSAVPWEVAGSLFVAGTTACAMVRAVAVAPGDVVAVAGATGGVGSIAVQLAKRAGAAVSGIAGERHREWLSSEGVDWIPYGEGIEERLRSATPRDGRIDAMLDASGEGYVELALKLGVARRPDRHDCGLRGGPEIRRQGRRNRGGCGHSRPARAGRPDRRRRARGAGCRRVPARRGSRGLPGAGRGASAGEDRPDAVSRADPVTDSAEPVLTSAVVGHALRRAAVVERGRVSLRAGVVAAIPVAGMLALGTAVGSPTAAVTMGVGAMLVGVAWRAGGPLVPPIGTMTAAAAALAIASLCGSLTGRWPWLHLTVLALFCLLAGAATALGRRGTVPGTQALIAFIVFGRFPQPLGTALAGSALVLAGGACQIALASLVALPLAWRRQRAGVAFAYQRLSELAGSILGSGLAAASALEAAERLLSTPALFADQELTTLANLVAEGRRIRLELIVLGAAVAQLRRTASDDVAGLEPQLAEALKQVAKLLSLIGGAVAGVRARASELEASGNALGAWGAERSPLAASSADPALVSRIDRRIAALTGEVTAAAALAAAATRAGRSGWVYGRPSLGGGRALRALASDLGRIRESASLHSPAGRHAVRLAVVVAGTELLVQRLALPRGYWAVVAAATVLRPSFGATFTRGAERALGTLAGVVIATLIADAIDPGGWAIVAVVGVLALYTFAVFPASFAAGVAGLTAVIVFLLHAVAPASASIALDRGIDTAIGAAIGLTAYALWPTWSGTSTGRLLAGAVDAQRDYLRAVLGGLVSGRKPADARLRPLARRARTAWTDAEAAVTLARSEPPRGRQDPKVAGTTLAALRRVVYGVHALRLESDATTESPPMPARWGLASALDESLGLVADQLRDHDVGDRRALPPLRQRYREAMRQEPAGRMHALQAPLDELVDATDTAADAIGLELP